LQKNRKKINFCESFFAFLIQTQDFAGEPDKVVTVAKTIATIRINRAHGKDFFILMQGTGASDVIEIIERIAPFCIFLQYVNIFMYICKKF
jgi:hypothetical protein